MMKACTESKSCRRNFTLIELLVVVAIIAILAGMLLPALGSARDRAQSIQCLSNEKQLGTAVQFYAGDANGFIPCAVMYYIPGVRADMWHSVLNEYLGKNNAVLNCPGVQVKPTTWRTDYGWNYHGWGWDAADWGFGWKIGSASESYGGPVKLSRISNPSSVLMIGDRRDTEASTGFFGPGTEDGAYIPIRHRNSVNVVWADGHASSVDWRAIKSLPYKKHWTLRNDD